MNGIRIADRLEAVTAKRIHVFENGNADSFGRVLLINSTRERTWNKILTHVTQILEPSYGIVRRLISIDGKESVHSFSELNHGARYVACGKEQFNKVAGGYCTESEYKRSKKKTCSKLYPKQEKEQEEVTEEYWALRQAQKNKRTVIYVFSNGRKHHAPAKFVLIDSDFRNWPRTLSHIADKLDKPEGIRYLYTVYGHRVCGPCEIQHGACYVATAFGEKFQKLSYMDSYRDLVLNKKKSGETIKQFNIGAISSPMGLQIRNDDCFLTRGIQYYEKAKPATKRKEKKRSVSSNRSSEKRLSKERKRHSPSKRAKSTHKKDESENTVSGELKEEKLYKTTKATSSPLQDMNDIDEVTVEEVGIKVVTDRQIETNSQITQTLDKNPLRHNNSKLVVVNTPECGIRIIGADEVTKRMSSNDHASSRAIAASPQNREDIINLVETKSVAIFEYPEIIPNNNDYSDDTVDNECRPAIHRRSTGFNLNFGSNFLTPVDSDDDDETKGSPAAIEEEVESVKNFSDYSQTFSDSVNGTAQTNQSNIQDSTTITENNEYTSVDSDLIAVVNRSDVSTQGSELFKEEKGMQFAPKEMKSTGTDYIAKKDPVTCNNASIQGSEQIREEKAVQIVPKEKKSTETDGVTKKYPVTCNNASTQESEQLKEEKGMQIVPKEMKSTGTDYFAKKYFITYNNAATQRSEQLKEENALQIVPKEMKSTETDYEPKKYSIMVNDASNQKSGQLKEGKTQTNFPTEMKTTNTSNAADKDKTYKKIQEFIVGVVGTQPMQSFQSIAYSATGIDKEMVTDKPKKQEPQGKQCSKVGLTESETTEEKRSAIASEVQQLLQKGDKFHLKLCNEMQETSRTKVDNLQTENELNKFERAYETGIIKDAFCLCNSPYVDSESINEQQFATDDGPGTSQNCNQIPREVQPLWSAHSTETQTESYYLIPDNMDQKPSTLKYYMLRSGTYNEFLEMPYDASELETIKQHPKHKTKRKNPFCRCFNFCK